MIKKRQALNPSPAPDVDAFSPKLNSRTSKKSRLLKYTNSRELSPNEIKDVYTTAKELIAGQMTRLNMAGRTKLLTAQDAKMTYDLVRANLTLDGKLSEISKDEEITDEAVEQALQILALDQDKNE